MRTAAQTSRVGVRPAGRTTTVAAPKRQRRVSAKNLAVMTRQLSVMIEAGLPLVQCLEMLSKEEPDKRLADAIRQVQRDVEAGASLAEAMERQPHAFNPLFTHMIAAGEAGGILDVILSDCRRTSRGR